MNNLQTITKLNRTNKNKYNNRNLKAIFLPVFNQINPYQQQLINNLVDLGMQIEGGNVSNYLIATIIKQGKPDILHLHWLHPLFIRSNLAKSLFRLTALIVELYILKLIGVKIVWTAHNIKNHDSLYVQLDQICTKFIAKISHRIIAHSQTAKEEIINQLNIKNHQKIFVVPHGNYIGYYDNHINRAEARNKLNIPNEKAVMLLLGSIRENKGVLELIENFKQINREAVELIVAGKPANKELEQTIEEQISNNQNIKFISGFVPDEEIQTYMNACDVVVFPYQEILTSGAVFLAMSFKKACIAPRQGCLGEVLDDNGAFLYNPDCQNGLFQAIESAIKNKHQLISMGKYNFELADKFDWSNIADITLQVYQSCLTEESTQN
ncbi:group 1 glycosyl transferase [Calothrix parasitica NIES-267]|uniref:Group 1 glycosyl transferase n=1 Tax=Calothrix parasitica NIES-267 TaxID=1973488 RepID=A0A1Z4LSV2_9CYAN|nr:group 1 glycosyl transferase [Calothrix parasitica NIES-267]